MKKRTIRVLRMRMRIKYVSKKRKKRKRNFSYLPTSIKVKRVKG
jgi:hypothetical protein